MISRSRNLRRVLAVGVFGLFSSLTFAIDAPSSPRASEVAQSLVKWEWDRVPGAVSYDVIVDGSAKGLTSDAQSFSRGLWAGEHSMTVRAVGSDGSYSPSTPTVKIVVSSKYSSRSPASGFVVGQSSSSGATTPVASAASGSFSAPQGVRGSEVSGGTVQWEWNAVSGATGYDVTVDGAYIGNTSNLSYTSYNLWAGEHSVTVKAVSSNGSRSVQSDTIKVWVTGNSSGTYVAPPPEQDTSVSDSGNIFIDDTTNNRYSSEAWKSGYELSFSDEFDGGSLNQDRWHTQLRWDGEFNGERYEYRVINGEDQLYVNIFSEDPEHRQDIVPLYNPFEFNGSRLAIRAAKNPLKSNNNKATYGPLSTIAAQQTFLSGVISSHGKFSQKYGYFEARIKIPGHVGAFPAFWLFHEKRAWEGTQRSEIDIMENLGHAPWYIYNSFHYFKNVTASYSGDANFLKPRPSGQIYTGIDYSNDFHIYAVKWEPGKITWYIDNQQVSVLESNEVDFEELYVKLNLAMGGNWTNFPANSGGLGRSDSERYPNQNDLDTFNNPALEIDYVRVYKPI